MTVSGDDQLLACAEPRQELRERAGIVGRKRATAARLLNLLTVPQSAFVRRPEVDQRYSMIPYWIVPDGLSAFGVELTIPGQFRSVRGFASVAEAYAWVVEQDKAEAHRIASVARRVQPAPQLIRRNHDLRCQAERVWHQTGLLCSPSLTSRVILDMKVTTDELIERNHRLLAHAAAVYARALQVHQTAAAHLVRAEQALVLRQAEQAARAASRARLPHNSEL